MRYYPAYLDIRGRPCVVVGGGAVAERKTLSLLQAGAGVTIISPAITPKLHEISASGQIKHLQKTFDEADIEGMVLVIAATDSPDVNGHVAKVCKRKEMLVNVAMPPQESNFIVPSVMARGDLVITISTSGASPALSKKIRHELERCYGPEYELFLASFSIVRKRILEEVTDEDKRKNIFHAIVDSDAIELFRQGRAAEAEKVMFELAGLKHCHRESS